MSEPVRWHCERCGHTFTEPASDEEARAIAADFYECDPDELDQEDLDTMGCLGCGYAGCLVPA
jgi:hypothetical protein